MIGPKRSAVSPGEHTQPFGGIYQNKSNKRVILMLSDLKKQLEVLDTKLKEIRVSL